MKPPEFLGPYRIGETLGRGGMGTVYQARHEKSGEQVAVKLIATQVSDEMRFRRRFHAEIETLKRLKHPNIVRLIGYGEEQGMLFYSMEFVDGETVQDMIRRDKRIPWKQSLDIAIQVCGALKHAHDFGVIHRDLKPANLIVQKDGTVKLVDFGISKIFGHDQTALGSVMGTADYMAPEQAGDGGITPRTDLYALGCVLYAMLAGRPPFRGKSVTEVISALKFKEAVPLDMVDPDLPEDIVQIVDELLAKSPDQRPPTALAVMNRLKAMRGGLDRMQTLQEGSGGAGGASHDTAFVSPAEQADDESRGGRQPYGDTLESMPQPGHEATDISQINPSAGTIKTEGRGGDRVTAVGTAATEHRRPRETGPRMAEPIGQTHFQTVTEGDVREGHFASSSEQSESDTMRALSIVAITVALLAGIIFLAVSLRGPDADELLARIDQRDRQSESYEFENDLESFLKLFPDHPRAEEMRRLQTEQRVESVIRRLKLKDKLRMDESPLYEQAFLEAMSLRQSDPQQSVEKLRHWINVFHDPSIAADDERTELTELAQFEAERLDQLAATAPGGGRDARVAELMQRIDDAQSLPEPKQRKLLESIITLYEDQPWAEDALQRAREQLEQLGS
ncbi:serine/threonine protein kinase [Roseiconus nitratireducens]|uniref:Serine/threonine protein kinase n=1 Tax=Roseiconus nitratireducens TaxID=2605748 RepID=A0A5M6D434_9BACT|nr:serine/threonine-protein kinase [Roseiconus nitratireducens]KAA5540499.1 serine/threonine protein kinase [Roseiconus nitratireducens]